ncbi:protoporphyrinogen oxidase [Microlunatus soli]|uniref:Coproporphyrinogen III oxidase n=1 Tax=Microlunatus soli TaxID=630515 RepID=A0A1H2AQQ4_9ACTN|nr:protoporphyrinogen oxidase [Microlunatus soli]SDT48112.1 oxygen-dependent protoporphyrinogen oxidase [Microlunatus soli]
MTATVVVGAGISGLSAAHQLATETSDTIIVCDAAPRLGGKLHRLALDDPADLDQGPDLVDGRCGDPALPFTVDVGAESMLARRPEGLELITALGLDDHRVHPTTARAQAFLDGRITPLPPSNMGVPTDLEALGGFLSDAGLRRARAEVDHEAPALAGDVSIGSYVADRFGDEVTDRLLEPMLGGVYAGQSRRLSFEAVHPGLFAAARQGGSLLAAAQQVAAAAKRSNDQSVGSAPPVFAGLIGGVSGVITALEDDLRSRGVAIRSSTTVREIRREPGVDHGGRFTLVTGPVPAPELITADRVVLATPAAPTARLLRALAPEAATALAEIPYASMAVITFVLADAELSGSGLLVPPGELPTIKAFTYSSNKWDWIADRAAAGFGAGTAVVRASVGRFGEEQLLQVDDHELARRTLAEARAVPGWQSARPLRTRVQRWGGGLPQYLVGHRDRIQTIRSAVAAVGGIAVAGAYLDGVGLPSCIAAARRAVADL